jgi:hypothetical protein
VEKLMALELQEEILKLKKIGLCVAGSTNILS